MIRISSKSSQVSSSIRSRLININSPRLSALSDPASRRRSRASRVSGASGRSMERRLRLDQPRFGDLERRARSLRDVDGGSVVIAGVLGRLARPRGVGSLGISSFCRPRQRGATPSNREEADEEEGQQDDDAGDDPEGRLIHRLILVSC